MSILTSLGLKSYFQTDGPTKKQLRQYLALSVPKPVGASTRTLSLSENPHGFEHGWIHNDRQELHLRLESSPPPYFYDSGFCRRATVLRFRWGRAEYSFIYSNWRRLVPFFNEKVLATGWEAIFEFERDAEVDYFDELGIEALLL